MGLEELESFIEKNNSPDWFGEKVDNETYVAVQCIPTLAPPTSEAFQLVPAGTVEIFKTKEICCLRVLISPDTTSTVLASVMRQMKASLHKTAKVKNLIINGGDFQRPGVEKQFLRELEGRFGYELRLYAELVEKQ